MPVPSPFLYAAALLGLAGTAPAATIAYLGVQTNVESYADDADGWRTSTTLKSYDFDGDNVLGTDGYQLFPTNAVDLPDYVSSITTGSGVSGWGGGGGYALVDNPAGGADISSGVYYFNGIAGGQTRDMFSFTLSGTVPSIFTIHLLAGASDNAVTTANTSFILAQTSGGSSSDSAALVASSSDTDGPDWYTFRISGASAGDVFTMAISNDGPNEQNLQVGGIAFDTVPEPETPFQVIAFAGALLIWRNRGRTSLG